MGAHYKEEPTGDSVSIAISFIPDSLILLLPTTYYYYHLLLLPSYVLLIS